MSSRRKEEAEEHIGYNKSGVLSATFSFDMYCSKLEFQMKLWGECKYHNNFYYITVPCDIG